MGKIIVALVLLIIIAPLILFLLSPVIDVFKNQVTVYPVSTDYKGHEVALNKSVYKVFPDTQIVIYWYPDIMGVPHKLANCSVRDRLHWKCEYADGSGGVMMSDYGFTISPLKPDIRYVSRWKWWKLSIGLHDK